VALDSGGVDHARRAGYRCGELRAFEAQRQPTTLASVRRKRKRAAAAGAEKDERTDDEWIVFGPQLMEGPETRDQIVLENGRPIVRWVIDWVSATHKHIMAFGNEWRREGTLFCSKIGVKKLKEKIMCFRLFA